MATAVPTDQLVDRALNAQKAARSAVTKARKVAGDQKVNRTTRQRHALKIKADALDQVAGILAGKA